MDDLSSSITADSSRDFIDRNDLMLRNYLRETHHRMDWAKVSHLLYNAFPDEGKKLLQNFGMLDPEKKNRLIQWIVHSAQITCIVMGDQRMGKDATLCKVFEEVIDYCKKSGFDPPRFVTLGNIKAPWFVSEKDMYFSFRKIPFGTKRQPVYIYCGELEVEFPARDFAGKENKLFSILEGTMAQNHQKLFGCVKLMAKVDLSVIRSCNLKLFKFISPEKLEMEGIERVNVLSDLGRWFLPKDVQDKAKCLLVFDNNLLTTTYALPSFWTDEYSEQFRGGTISHDKIMDFVKSKLEYNDKPSPAQLMDIQTVVYQKFRKEVSLEEIRSLF